MKIRNLRMIALMICIASYSFAGIGDVDYNSGDLRFSRTLMTVSGRTLTYPIAIQYSSDIKRAHHFTDPTTDIKPQASSWVGLGFDLDAPYIERIIMGGPDNCQGHTRDYSESDNYVIALRAAYATHSNQTTCPFFYDFFNYKPLIKIVGSTIGNNFHENERQPEEYSLPAFACPNEPQCLSLNPSDDFFLQCSYFNAQTQQDVYVLRNFPAGDVKLYFSMSSINGKLQISTIPYKPWKIDYTMAPGDYSGSTAVAGDVLSWTIIDENGTRYTFGGDGGTSDVSRIILAPSTDLDKPFDLLRLTYEVSSTNYRKHLATSAVFKEYDRSTSRWYMKNMATYDGKDELKFTYTNISAPPVAPSSDYITGLKKWVAEPLPRVVYEIYSSIYADRCGEKFDLSYAWVTLGTGFGPVYDALGVSYDPNSNEYSPSGVDYYGRRVSTILPGPTVVSSIQPSLAGAFAARGNCPYVVGGGGCTALLDNISLGYNKVLVVKFPTISWANKFLGFQYDCSDFLSYGTVEDYITGNNKKECYVQAQISNDQVQYANTLFLSSIETPLEKLIVETDIGDAGATRTNQDRNNDPLYRPRLKSLLRANKLNDGTSNVTDAMRVVFMHSYNNFGTGTGSAAARMVLNGVDLATTTASVKTQHLYQFQYQPLGTVECDKFGYVNQGQITGITTKEGSITSYTYEKGSFRRLTCDNSKAPTLASDYTGCGWRVSQVTQSGRFAGQPDVVNSIKYVHNFGQTSEYSSGELPYDAALQEYPSDDSDPYYSPDPGLKQLKWFYRGLLSSLAFIDYTSEWQSKAPVLLQGLKPQYVEVWVKQGTTSGQTQFVYNGATEFPDEENEYHIADYYRGNLKKETKYTSSGAIVQSTENTYTHYDYSSGGNKTYYYRKPTTFVQQFELLDDGDPRISQQCCISGNVPMIPDLSYNNSGENGLPAAVTCRSQQLRILSTKTSTNGVTTTTAYTFNNQGFVKGMAVYNENDQVTKRLTSYTYLMDAEAYGSVPAFSSYVDYIRGRNILSPVVTSKTQLIESVGATTTAYTVRSSATTWNSYSTGDWYPHQNYVWRSDLDVSGKPTTVYTLFNYGNILQNATRGWLWQGEPTQINLYGQVVESTVPTSGTAATVYNTTIYRNDWNLPVAQVTNARYGECFFTEFSNTDIGDIQGTASMTSTAGEHLFSERAVKFTTAGTGDQYARSAFTPQNADLAALGGRTFKIDFWAKSDAASTNKSFIHLQSDGAYTLSSTAEFGLTPIWKKYSVDVTFPTSCNDKRYSIVLRPPASSPWTFMSGTVFYDDIRVYPKGALMATTYYDPKWHQPVVTIDANNNPGQKVTYDDFGRPIESRKIDKSNPSSTQLVMKKEYHLMGDAP